MRSPMPGFDQLMTGLVKSDPMDTIRIITQPGEAILVKAFVHVANPKNKVSLQIASVDDQTRIIAFDA
jgi:hypothetical protein